MKQSILLFSFFFVVLACSAPKRIASGGGSTSSPTKPSSTFPVPSLNPIFDSKWLLSDAEKISDDIFIQFRNKEGKQSLNGNASCNRYSGEVSIQKNGKIDFPASMTTTKMSCENLQEERNYLALLSECNRYQLQGNELRLYKNKILLLRFVKE